jgi:hypothetical protein
MAFGFDEGVNHRFGGLQQRDDIGPPDNRIRLTLIAALQRQTGTPASSIDAHTESARPDFVNALLGRKSECFYIQPIVRRSTLRRSARCR